MKSSFLIILGAVTALAVTQTAHATSPDYIVTTSTGASIVPGTDDIGLHNDDFPLMPISLPFPVTFYDQVFNSVQVSSNGYLVFTSADTYDFCLPTADASNLILPASQDMYTGDPSSGQGVFTSISGTAPNRIFNIEWRTVYCCTDGLAPINNFEVRLYEGQRRIDFIYGANGGSNYTGIGVQRDTGSQFTKVACGNLPDPGTQYTFTIPDTCVPPPPNMVAWWRGDGNADDSIGGHHGSLLGGATFAPGKVDQGFSFDGTGDYVSVPSPAGNFGTGDFTIDFWMQTSTTGTREIINKRLCGDTSSNGFEVRLNGGSLLVELLRDNDPTGSNVTSGRTYNDGQFHHIAIVRSGNTLSIYGDGTLDNSTTDPNVGSTDITNTLPLGIGGGGCSDSPPAGDGTATFAGILDEVELFNRALSEQEISDIFIASSAGKCKCTPPPANMIGWWPGEGDGTDIQGGNSVSFSGSGTFAAGEVGQAFSFDGSGYATAGNPDSLRLTGTAVSIDAWVNPASNGSTVFIAGKTASSFNDYVLFLNNGILEGGIKTAGVEHFIADYTLPTNTWTHVALTYDGTTLKIFANGVIVASDSVSGNLDGSNSEFAIGGRSGEGFLNGSVDEVEVFDRALTDDEVIAIYHAGSAGKCRPCISAPSGMIDWWPGDGNANDIQGGHGATLQNGATFASGEVAGAFSFDGTDDFVSLPASSDWNFGTGDFTFDFWARGNGTSRMQALSFDPDLGTRNLDFDFNDTFGLWVYWNSGGSNSIQVGAPGDYTDGKWHHYALTRSGTTLTLYIDGASKGNTTFSDPIDLSGGNNNYFGAGINTGSPGYFWNGGIDEVEIFNRALSASEIATIYDAGSGGKCKPAIPATRQLANISSRASVGTDDNVAIGGFIIHSDPANPNRSHTNGTPVATKRVIIRGIGPSLQVNGVPVSGRLADPVLELHDNSNGGALLETNDNWGDAANAADIQASGFAPSDPNESAILVTLNSHNSYSAILRGAGNSSGIGVVEVFDLEGTSDTHLANISTRAFVSTGDDVLIGGLIVKGGTPARVIVRAIGPSLTAFNVPNALQDPALELHDANGALIASNDDWGSSPDAAAIGASGFAPSNAKESAILFVPAPGNYTAIVSGNGPTPTGVGLVESFRLQN